MKKGSNEMEFDFEGTFYVEPMDLREMYLLCKKNGYTPQQALNCVSASWDDCDFYLVGMVEDKIIAEIEHRLKQSEVNKND